MFYAVICLVWDKDEPKNEIYLQHICSTPELAEELARKAAEYYVKHRLRSDDFGDEELVIHRSEDCADILTENTSTWVRSHYVKAIKPDQS